MMQNFAALRSALEVRSRQPEPLASVTKSDAASAADESRAIKWRPIVVQATVMWLITRLALAALTYFALFFTLHGNPAQAVVITPHAMLTSWDQWDALWYIKLATRGYYDILPTAFFPLYPLLIRIPVLIFGSSHALLFALVVSNLSALGAFIGLGLFAAQEDGPDAAPRVVRLLAAYPLAFFLAAPYTEGLFLAATVFCLFLLRKGSWRWAAACALVAALTRPTGAILILPLAWEYARQHGWLSRWGERLRKSRETRLRTLFWETTSNWRMLGEFAMLLGAVPLGFALYGAYLGVKFGHPLLFLHVQNMFWHRSNIPLWRTIPDAIGQFMQAPSLSYWQGRDLVDVAPVIIFTVLALIGLRRLPFAFSLYTFALLYLTVGSPTSGPVMLVSAGRFLIAAAPIFLLLGRWTKKHPWLDLLLVSAGFFLQALLAVFFLGGNWLV